MESENNLHSLSEATPVFSNIKLKILHLVTEREHRGGQVFAAELSALQVKQGHQVLFVGLYKKPDNLLIATGAQNIDLSGKKIPFDFILLFRLIKLIKNTQPDIIQANGSDTLKYAVAAKIFCPRINIVYRNISMISSWSKQGSLKRRLNKLLFKQADRVTSVGQKSLDDLRKIYDFPFVKSRVIHRGIPQFSYDRVVSRQKIVAEFCFPETDNILLHIGRFSPEKNHIFLVECFQQILKRMNNVRLLFIGEGKKLDEIKQMVIQKKLENHIFFAGHCSHVQELLAGSDLFLMGSTIEGVPGVILEAGMQSVPTVAVSTGGVGEVVINGKTGILLDNYVPEDFSNGVISLLQDDTLRQSLGTNAKEFVIENYSLQNCVKGFDDLYMDILKEKK